jgi:hypothetical protein
MITRTKLIGLLVILLLAVLGSFGFTWAMDVLIWGILLIFVATVIVTLLSWSSW